MDSHMTVCTPKVVNFEANTEYSCFNNLNSFTASMTCSHTQFASRRTKEALLSMSDARPLFSLVNGTRPHVEQLTPCQNLHFKTVVVEELMEGRLHWL